MAIQCPHCKLLAMTRSNRDEPFRCFVCGKYFHPMRVPQSVFPSLHRAQQALDKYNEIQAENTLDEHYFDKKGKLFDPNSIVTNLNELKKYK